MRESMGGTWLFGIMALFIVLFSGFIAYSITYSKAFKTKNQIINLIEKKEGYTLSNGGTDVTNMSEDQLYSDPSTEAQAYYYIKKSGYNTDVVDCVSLGYGVYQDGGYCIQRFCNGNNYTAASDDGRVYYKVTTFIKVNIPVINVQVNIPITGETKAMYYENPAVSEHETPCYDIATGN